MQYRKVYCVPPPHASAAHLPSMVRPRGPSQSYGCSGLFRRSTSWLVVGLKTVSMCNLAETKAVAGPSGSRRPSPVEAKVPIERILEPPSALARSTCVSILVGIFAIWGNYVFIDEEDVPGGRQPIHNGCIPLSLTVFYLMSLPLLRMFTNHYLQTVDVKLLLRESMILYNAAQVLLNGWMVYRILDALVFRGHPFIAGHIHKVDTGAAYAVWVHYCDKYLEFLDTYFMVLRGKTDQVSDGHTALFLARRVWHILLAYSSIRST
jgi:hypothetical protein